MSVQTLSKCIPTLTKYFISYHHSFCVYFRRKVQAKKHREGAKAWNKKNQLGSYCNVDEKDKLEVFTGNMKISLFPNEGPLFHFILFLS